MSAQSAINDSYDATTHALKVVEATSATGGILQKPITIAGIQSLVVDNTTGSIIPFRITGSVRILGLWGVVTTVLSSNVTAAFLRVNDQTAQSNITLNTGVTLSAAPVGSLVIKKGLAAAALAYTTSAAATVVEPTTLETLTPSEFVVVGKPAVNNDLEFRYTTTNAPSTGAIRFYVQYVPLSADGAIVAL